MRLDESLESGVCYRYVLVSAGNIKRERLAKQGDSALDDGEEQKVGEAHIGHSKCVLADADPIGVRDTRAEASVRRHRPPSLATQRRLPRCAVHAE